MADQMMTPVLGKWRAYTDGSMGAGALMFVILKSAQADGTLRTHATLSALLAGSGNVEADWSTGTPYARKTGIAPVAVPGVARQDVDIADQTWANAGTSGAFQDVVKIVVCWRFTANTADSATIPLGHADFPERANGADLTSTIATSGLFAALG